MKGTKKNQRRVYTASRFKDMLVVKHYARSDKGVTLIEVMVVMAIMAILSLVTLGIITSLFDSSIRTSKYLDQNTTIETMYGFLASRLSTTQVGNLGTVNASDPTKINPLSVAGDQFVFQSRSSGSSSSDTYCYRIFYLKANSSNANGLEAAWLDDKYDDGGDSIWASVYPADNGCADIAPTKGPNQTAVGASAPDPVLNPTSGVPLGSPFVLASKISSQSKSGSTSGSKQCNAGDTNDPVLQVYRNPLVPFFFCDTETQPWTADIMATADSAQVATVQNNSFYGNSTNLNDVIGVQAVAYVDSGGSPSVPVRQYAQTFAMNQVQLGCELVGGTSTDLDVDVDTEVVPALNADTEWHNVQGEGGTDSLGVTFLNSWTNFSTDYPSAGFYKDKFNIVRLKGLIKDGALGPAFTLPAGYHPPRSIVFWGYSGGGGIARIDVTSTGNVHVYGGVANYSNSYLSLNGISFRTN